MIAGGYGNENPNTDWVGNSKGFFLFYLIFLAMFHLLLLSLPFVDISFAWTCTNIIHNLAHLYFLHGIKGGPWISGTDNGRYKRETHWEQMDDGATWTPQKKFLTSIPIILFLLTCLYTKNSEAHFLANLVSLVVVLVPKMPIFHHVRILNINKY